MDTLKLAENIQFESTGSRIMDSVRASLSPGLITHEMLINGELRNLQGGLTQSEFDVIWATSMRKMHSYTGITDRGYKRASIYDYENYLHRTPTDINGYTFVDSIALKTSAIQSGISKGQGYPSPMDSVVTLDLGGGQGWTYLELMNDFAYSYQNGILQPRVLSLGDHRGSLPVSEQGKIPDRDYLIGDMRNLSSILAAANIPGLDVVYSCHALYQLSPVARIKVVEDVYNSLNIGGVAHLHMAHYDLDPIVEATGKFIASGFDFQDTNPWKSRNSHQTIFFSRLDERELNINLKLIQDKQFLELLQLIRAAVGHERDPHYSVDAYSSLGYEMFFA